MSADSRIRVALPFANAQGDGNDVLGAPANSTPIMSEFVYTRKRSVSEHFFRAWAGEGNVAAGSHHAGGQPPGDFLGMAQYPPEGNHRTAAEHVGNNRAGPHERLVLQAFTTLTTGRSASRAGAICVSVCRRYFVGDRSDEQIGAADRLANVAVTGMPIGNADAGEQAFVLAIAIDVPGVVGISAQSATDWSVLGGVEIEQAVAIAPLPRLRDLPGHYRPILCLKADPESSHFQRAHAVDALRVPIDPGSRGRVHSGQQISRPGVTVQTDSNLIAGKGAVRRRQHNWTRTAVATEKIVGTPILSYTFANLLFVQEYLNGTADEQKPTAFVDRRQTSCGNFRRASTAPVHELAQIEPQRGCSS